MNGSYHPKEKLQGIASQKHFASDTLPHEKRYEPLDNATRVKFSTWSDEILGNDPNFQCPGKRLNHLFEEKYSDFLGTGWHHLKLPIGNASFPRIPTAPLLAYLASNTTHSEGFWHFDDQKYLCDNNTILKGSSSMQSPLGSNRGLAFFHSIFDLWGVSQFDLFPRYNSMKRTGNILTVSFAVIMLDALNYHFTSFVQEEGFSTGTWHRLSPQEIDNLAELYGDLITQKFLRPHKMIDKNLNKAFRNTLLACTIAIFLVSTCAFFLSAWRALWKWWNFQIGPCRRCGSSRVPHHARRTRPSKIHKIFLFGWLLTSAEAMPILNQNNQNLDDRLTRESSLPSFPGMWQDFSTSSLVRSFGIGQTGSVQWPFSRVWDPGESFMLHKDYLDCRVGRTIDLLYCSPSGQFAIIDDTGQLLRWTDQNSEDSQALFSVVTLDVPTKAYRNGGNFDSESLLVDSTIAELLEMTPQQLSFRISETPIFGFEDMNSLMQLPGTPGETCGRHTDPVIYWDRLAFMPPIIMSRFYVWLTFPGLAGRLQHNLYSVPWDGRRCVRCSFCNLQGMQDTTQLQGPFYIRPQPPALDGIPVLHFMALNAPKTEQQRAFYARATTMTGIVRGTLVLDTFAGIVNVATIFDAVLPQHACRSSSWCRVRWNDSRGYQIAWWPDNILVLDFSFVELDEFNIQPQGLPVIIAGPPASSYSCSQTNPDPGGTNYEPDDQSFLTIKNYNFHDDDEVSWMHMPHRAASRSRSSNSREDSRPSNARDSLSTEDDSSSDCDALIVFSRYEEPLLIPIGTDVTPDDFRVVVAQHKQFDPTSRDWQALSVHPVRPKPADMASCIIPLIVILQGQHTMTQAFILLDIDLHSNEVDVCGEKEDSYAIRETWTVPTMLTRTAFLHWIGVANLCQNVAFPCLVELGSHPWLQQDSRAHTMIDGLFVRVVIHIPQPQFAMTLYLHYSRQGVSWSNMENHWRQQTAASAERLQQMFDADDEHLIEEARVTEQAMDGDSTSLMTFSILNNQSDMDEEDTASFMVRPHPSTDRSRSPRPAPDSLILYELHAPPHSTTLDPDLLRRDYRATIGAIMDIPNPSRLWDNFEIHQIRPLPPDHDPLHTLAFLYVHPMTIVRGLSFVLVQISVTHETTVCGRFETATERAVHRVPAHLARETFLQNVRIWDLCVVSGTDQCEVKLPDRIWSPDDLENHFLFDGSYVQVKCTTPYTDVPVQTQLRASLSGMSYQTMISTFFGGDHNAEEDASLMQLPATRRSLRDSEDIAPFRHPMEGLPPPGNPQIYDIGTDSEEETMPVPPKDSPCSIRLDLLIGKENTEAFEETSSLNTLDEVEALADGKYQIKDRSTEKPLQLHLSEILKIPRPLIRTSTCPPPAADVELPYQLEAKLFEEPEGYRGLLDFDPELDSPRTDWKNIPDLLPCVFEGMQPLETMSFEHWNSQDTSSIVVFTDGSSSEGKAAWACAVFAFHQESWEFMGFMSGQVPSQQEYHLTAMTAELFALLHATWWLVRLCDVNLWKGLVTFHWDSTVAGQIADGHFSSQKHLLAQHVRQAQQALEAILGREWIVHQHVRAHSGVWQNEMVDAAAKWALQLPPPIDHGRAVCQLLKKGLKATAWLWLHLQASNNTMPSYENGTLRWNRHGSNPDLDVSRVIRTGILPQHGLPQSSCFGQFHLQVGTYNCLSLGTSTDDEQGTGQTVLGRVALMRNRAISTGFHVLGIQEARTEVGQTISQTHLRISSGRKEDGTLGVELWIALHKPFCWRQDDEPHCFRPRAAATIYNDPRILVVMYHDPMLRAIFVVAHAPHTGHSAEERHTWWNDLQERLSKFPQEEVILMIDANSRFAGTPTQNFGDLPEGPISHNGYRFQECMENLGLFAPATFSCWQCGPGMTWQHPNGKHQSRIDYVLLPLSWRNAIIKSWIEIGFHSGLTALDHLCAAISISWTANFQSQTTRKTGFDQAALHDPANRPVVENILSTIPDISWDTNATEHAGILVEHLQQQLSQHFPLKKRPHSFTLATEETLTTFHTMTRSRRQLRTYRAVYAQLVLRFWFDQWRGESWEESALRWAATFFRYNALAARDAHSTAKDLYRQLRRDKSRFVDSLAPTLIDAAPHEVYRQLQPLLPTRKRQRTASRPLTQLEHSDGTLTNTPEEVENRWIEHFAALEAGSKTDPPDFVHRSVERQTHTCMPSEWTYQDMPTLQDLENAIRRIRLRKAAGPDALPGEILRIAPAQAAKLLFPLLTKFSCRIEEPVQFKGGALFALYKGKGTHTSCSSFRSILLMSSIGKTLRAAMRHIINEPYAQKSDPLQLAGKRGQTVVFGAQVVRHFLNYHKQKNCSAGIVFCDVASAFYKTVRELALGVDASDLGIATIVKRLGLDPAVLPLLHEALAGRYSYAALDATSAQQAFLRESLDSTWFTFGEHQFIETHCGSRPGDAWADVIFNVLFSQVLNKVAEELRHQGLILQLPWCADLCPWNTPSSLDPKVDLFHVTWADDLALLVPLGSPEGAAASLARAAGTLFTALRAFGMQIAFGKGKTEAMLLLRGRGAIRERRKLFSQSHPVLPVLEEETCTMLPLTCIYKHLGGMVTSSCSMQAEIRARISKARAAFGRLSRPIFQAKYISLKSKILIFRATVLSTLIWGSGAWPELTKQELQIFEAAIWDLYRKLLPIQLQDGVRLQYTHLEILERLRLPHPADLLQEQRARHFADLVRMAPQAVWALLFHDAAAMQAYRTALSWIKTAFAREASPPPLEDWDAWTALFRNYPGRWKRICRTASQRHLSHRLIWARVGKWKGELEAIMRHHHFADVEERRAEGAHWCLLCNRQFTKMTGWFLHSHHKHGYVSLPGAIVQGRFCPCCNKIYRSSVQLHHHLRYNANCRMYFWVSRNTEIEQPASATPFHPQCPWMHSDNAVTVEAPDWEDPEFQRLLSDLDEMLRSFMPPENDSELDVTLASAIKQTLTVVLPFSKLINAFRNGASNLRALLIPNLPVHFSLWRIGYEGIAMITLQQQDNQFGLKVESPSNGKDIAMPGHGDPRNLSSSTFIVGGDVQEIYSAALSHRDILPTCS